MSKAKSPKEAVTPRRAPVWPAWLGRHIQVSYRTLTTILPRPSGPGGAVFTRLRHEDFYPAECNEDAVHPAEHSEDVYPTECNEGVVVYPAQCNEDVYPDERSEDVAEAD